MEHTARENILVCVYYGPNAERLIQRGAKIAHAMSGALTILTVNPMRDNEYNASKERNMTEWKRLAEEHHAEFLAEESGSRSVANVIVDVARKKQITQIVVGESARTRWEELIHGSIINEILRQIDFIDVHVVSVQRVLPEQYEEDYEQGVRAHLLKTDDGMIMNVGESPTHELEGMFFKLTGTDFNSGVFKLVEHKKKTLYKISDGKVAEELKSS
ncbi:universal stress protein [Paenibacillus chungangensis]|uniref:Universal stress protein n=1 Tax=Paenibacillus chungangensis TaxID=696535 RepID=A0ABW3HL70_9BACL